jgi:hypothetical protein
MTKHNPENERTSANTSPTWKNPSATAIPVDVIEGCLEQDAHKVKTKKSETFTTYSCGSRERNFPSGEATGPAGTEFSVAAFMGLR